MNKIKVLKVIVNFIVGVGTTKIVYGIIKNNTDPENTFDKATIGAGSLVVGSMAGDATKSYTDTKIDDLAKAFQAKKTKTEQPDQT